MDDSKTAGAHSAGSAESTLRLAACVGLSLALHALTFAAYTPQAARAAPREPEQPFVLHATLSAPAPVEAARAASTRDSTPDAVDQARLALADRWYSAAELDVRAEPLTQVELEYPEALEGTGTIGRVRLLLYIDEKGLVRKAEIAASEPRRVFDQAALKGWQEVRFAPAQKNGVPVKSRKLLELDFTPQK